MYTFNIDWNIIINILLTFRFIIKFATMDVSNQTFSIEKFMLQRR